MRIVYADAALVIVDKPAGLLSVPGRGPDKADCASARAQALYPDAEIVHRLDMATSGLLVFARSKAAQRALSKSFAEGGVAKTYIADVIGVPEPAAGAIDLPLIADWPRRPLQKVDHHAGKPSVTHYRIMQSSSGVSRLEVKPLTGRSHQIRVHLAAIGHAILGDAFYAPPPVQTLSERLCLHAAALAFPHPILGHTIHVEAPVPF